MLNLPLLTNLSFSWLQCWCIFELCYIPVNNFSVMSGRVFLGWTSTKPWLMCLAQGNTQWRLWLCIRFHPLFFQITIFTFWSRKSKKDCKDQESIQSSTIEDTLNDEERITNNTKHKDRSTTNNDSSSSKSDWARITAMIDRYNLSQDTKWEGNKITINITNKSQEASPLPPGDTI